MAVTYAWRLDANKYAYILNPDKLKENITNNDSYGYVNEYPLSNEDINLVGENANKMFGEGANKTESANNKQKYVEAFGIMEGLIKEKWGDYDLLSADVYYNVDSANCADLRGVGIQSIRLIGVANPPETKGTVTIESLKPDPTADIKTPGAYLVYGVYMADQDIKDIDNVKDLPTPESIIVVRNGAIVDAEHNEDTITEILKDWLDTSVQPKIDELKEVDAKIWEQINNINSILYDYGGLSDFTTKITDLENEVKGLKSELQGLRNEFDAFRQQVLEFMNLNVEIADIGNGGGSSGGVSINGEMEGNNEYYVLGYDVGTNSICYHPKGLIDYNDGDSFEISSDGFHAKGFYQNEY